MFLRQCLQNICVLFVYFFLIELGIDRNAVASDTVARFLGLAELFASLSASLLWLAALVASLTTRDAPGTKIPTRSGPTSSSVSPEIRTKSFSRAGWSH